MTLEEFKDEVKSRIAADLSTDLVRADELNNYLSQWYSVNYWVADRDGLIVYEEPLEMGLMYSGEEFLEEVMYTFFMDNVKE